MKCRTRRSLKADFVRHFFDFFALKNYLFKKWRCSTNFSQNFIRKRQSFCQMQSPLKQSAKTGLRTNGGFGAVCP
jgi:hypothetical protein